MGFKLEKRVIGDILIISRNKYSDSRGSFSEIFKFSEFKDCGLPTNFTQDNLVFSEMNVLRGLHYQKNPHSQGKLLTVIDGDIFDVCVDIRKDSHTYGKHYSIKLSSTDNFVNTDGSWAKYPNP